MVNMSRLRAQRVRGVVGLYGLTPEWDDHERLETAVVQAVRGGMQALQLRHKQASPAQLKAQARRLRELCTQHGVLFVVNDDWRLALDVGADGVHVGRDDADDVTIARLVGEGLTVGVSCYNELERVRRALDAGAHSVALGAVYPSASKPETVRVSLETIRGARRLCEAHASDGARSSVIAIGGIEPTNAAPVAAAGADALAVINGLFGQPDVERAARAICDAMAPR